MIGGSSSTRHAILASGISLQFSLSLFSFHKSNQLISHFGQLHGEELNPQIKDFRDCIAPSNFKGDKYEQ